MDRPKSKPLSSLLRELRQRQGWSLKEMSSRCGVPVSTLSKVERGGLTLGYDRLLEVSERLGLTLPELLGMTDPQTEARITGRRSIGNVKHATAVKTPGGELLPLCAELRHKRITPFITRVLSPTEGPIQPVSRHRTEHFAYVLDGLVEVHTELYEPVILGPGECIYLDAHMQHAYRLAPNCQQATVLGVLLGSSGLTFPV